MSEHPGRARLHRPATRAALAGCVALLTVVLAVAVPGGAWATFTATTGSTETAAEVEQHHDLGRGTITGDYAATVEAIPSPHLYWQLDGVPGAGAARTVADASTHSRAGTRHSHPDLGVAGAPTGTSTPGTAIGLSGVDDISTGAGRTTPTAFSTEVWFRSSGGTGPLVCFGPTRTGSATLPDVAVHLTAGGSLAFGVRTPSGPWCPRATTATAPGTW